ncbi:type II toxin-antitoxin system HicB family antitoxin [Acetomicrobium hydrogeniformans]|uniref:Toxin-antitoxin system, antitoxin component, HicB family n=1 Tax=Acetomicrobium hydrogeniformans ATCC BAA-1850 TaxID=592015 RepID=A0A0T5X9J6_9BACT|nr:type II toxin-antitoxin system HicB family antitoxin [Acetomicrobium hydrogeniformans]KRT34357.1 toxin-antitoxin system, antitoxin component, HicB family [Acetomicrobium hydrogeniformans ATCC BAA-1850]
MSILTAFVETAMHEARYKMLEDGTFFGEIPSCPGVWANEKTLEVCRDVLREVLEEWLILKLRDGDLLPKIGEINLNTIATEA